MSMIKETWDSFGEGMWRKTPPLFTALGLCPSLAVTTTAMNGMVMGLSTAAVLFGTALLTLAIRNIVPKEVRIPIYTVLIASLVAVVDLLLSGLMPEVHALLGLFIPLIIVNCIVLGRVEVAFTRKRVLPAMGDALGYGLGFTWALTVIGSLRELMSAGTIFGAQVMPAGFTPWQIMRTPPGAFFTMGIILALLQLIRFQVSKRQAAGKTSTSEGIEAA